MLQNSISLVTPEAVPESQFRESQMTTLAISEISLTTTCRCRRSIRHCVMQSVSKCAGIRNRLDARPLNLPDNVIAFRSARSTDDSGSLRSTTVPVLAAGNPPRMAIACGNRTGLLDGYSARAHRFGDLSAPNPTDCSKVGRKYHLVVNGSEWQQRGPALTDAACSPKGKKVHSGRVHRQVV